MLALKVNLVSSIWEFSAWLLGACNSVNDKSPPTFFGLSDAVEFLPEVLSKDPWELAQLFKQWTCLREKSVCLTSPIKVVD